MLSPSSLFKEYGTASYEKSLAVLKYPLFFTDNAFLQCPERMGALLLVMGCVCMDVATDSARLRISEIRGGESLPLSTRPGRSESEGKVYLAGEHTSTRRGWMQGALESGLRTAQEIHQART